MLTDRAAVSGRSLRGRRRRQAGLDRSNTQALHLAQTLNGIGFGDMTLLEIAMACRCYMRRKQVLVAPVAQGADRNAGKTAQIRYPQEPGARLEAAVAAVTVHRFRLSLPAPSPALRQLV